MKILHLTGEREDMGGITSVVRNLYSASQPWNWNHAVWVNRDYVELRRPALSYRYSRHICSDSPHHLYILFQSIRAFFELNQLLARENFDIVHSHTRGTFLIALALHSSRRRSVLFTNHSYARRVGMYRWAASRAKFPTVVLTPNMARHYGLDEQFPIVNVISDCCADRFFDEPLTEKSSPSGRRPVRFAGIGNIMRWKNWHLIVHALAQMPEHERRQIEVSLWGPTPGDSDSQKYDVELRRLVRERHLEDRFLFRGATQSVSDCLRQADWFLLPSTNEPCSVALSEALALGVPALVSASGGNIDILRPEKTGLLFKPGDASDLAAKFRAISNGQIAPLPPEEIRETVRHRSASQVASQYRQVYERLLSKKCEP